MIGEGKKSFKKQSINKREYCKVTDEQRSILIDFIEQNEHISIREASDLLGLNYESSKSIWIIYRKQGRKYNIKARYSLLRKG